MGVLELSGFPAKDFLIAPPTKERIFYKTVRNFPSSNVPALTEVLCKAQHVSPLGSGGLGKNPRTVLHGAEEQGLCMVAGGSS